MGKKTNVPDVRFRGFDGEWESKLLREVISDFIVPMRDKPKVFSGNIPWTRIEDIEGRYINGTLSGQYVSIETISKMNLKIIPKNSLIVSASATFGVVAIVRRDLITNQTFIGLVPEKSCDIDFLFIFFHSTDIQNKMKSQSAGSTIFYIARESFEKMEICIPQKPEQAKIGTYFKNLDNLITLKHRKLNKLKNVKKSMLEKMFPQEGATVPEIRFQGFSGDWSYKYYGDVFCQTTKYVNPKDSKLELWSLTIKHGLTPKTDRYIRDFLVLKEDKFKAVHPGDILYNPMNMTFGAIGYSKLKRIVAVSGYYVTMKPNKDFDGYFIQTLMKLPASIESYKMCATGSLIERQRVQFPTFATIQSQFPNFGEQQKIGTYFKNLDRLISLQQKEIEKLKQIKSSFLSKMFV